jgi:hypothetical protein
LWRIDVQNPNDTEKAKRLAPALAELTRKLEAEGLEYSALIFSPEGEFLIRAGNTKHEGMDFVRLHYYLSLVIANLDAMGLETDLSDVAESAAGNTQDAGEIAAKLALACITVPTDMIPSRVVDLARQYLEATGA